MDDRGAIENLLHLYAERIDAGDFSGMADLFLHAAYRAGDGPPLDRDQVESVNRELVITYADGTPKTRHLISNAIIEVDAAAGEARSRSCFTVLQFAPETPLQPIVIGRYHDAFRRGAEGWHYSERRIFVDGLGDLTRHLRSVPAQIQR